MLKHFLVWIDVPVELVDRAVVRHYIEHLLDENKLLEQKMEDLIQQNTRKRSRIDQLLQEEERTSKQLKLIRKKYKRAISSKHELETTVQELRVEIDEERSDRIDWKIPYKRTSSNSRENIPI